MSEVKRFYLDATNGRRPEMVESPEGYYCGFHSYAAVQSELALKEESYKGADMMCTDLKAELTALREELAITHQHQKATDACLTLVDGQRDHWIEKCKAAEQRNATLTTLLREGLEEYKNGDDWIERVIEALRNQPTESGASDKPSIGSEVIIHDGIRAIVKAHHADGLIVGAGDGHIVTEWSKP